MKASSTVIHTNKKKKLDRISSNDIVWINKTETNHLHFVPVLEFRVRFGRNLIICLSSVLFYSLDCILLQSQMVGFVKTGDCWFGGGWVAQIGHIFGFAAGAAHRERDRKTIYLSNESHQMIFSLK